MNLRFFVIALLPVIYFLYSIIGIPTVNAHVLETDGSVGAVLHIDPADDPIVGENTTLFFDFKDKQNKFQIEKCDCRLMILENGQQIFSAPMSSASVSFTFPKKDIYSVQVNGTPLITNDFSPFSLKYDVRVDREANKSAVTVPSSKNWWQEHWIQVIGGLLIGGFFMLAIMKQRVS